MATGVNQQGDTARRNALQVIHTARFKANWNDAGIATGIPTGIWLPQGALIRATDVVVITAFNAATTNVFSAGTEATTYTNLVTNAQAAAGTLGGKWDNRPTGTALGPLTADAQIYYLYTQSGTAATAGALYVTVLYTVDNDRNVGQ